MKAQIVLLLLSSSYMCMAQKSTDTLMKRSTFIRFNVLNLVDVSEPNISFGGERRITNQVAVAMDAAYIVYSQRFHDMGKSSGFILRPAVRYFPEKSRIFFEAELHFKQHTHRIHDWLGRDVAGGVAAYEEYREFRLRKQVIGMHFKFGAQMPVSSKLWFEFYIGVGPHFRKFTIVDGKEFLYNVDLQYENVTSGTTERLVAIPIGWRIMYKLR